MGKIANNLEGSQKEQQLIRWNKIVVVERVNFLMILKIISNLYKCMQKGQIILSSTKGIISFTQIKFFQRRIFSDGSSRRRL